VRLLSDVPGLQLPVEKEYAYHVYFSFPLRVKNRTIRDRLMRYLAQEGIETRIMFYSMNKQPYYVHMFGWPKARFPVSENVDACGFYVGCSPALKTGDVRRICAEIKKGLSKRNG